MTEPKIGVPTTDVATCQYSATPDDPPCSRPPAVHVIVEGENLHGHYHDGVVEAVGLATCDEHLSIARRTAYVLAEHSYAATCGHDDAINAGDRCVAASEEENPSA